MCCSTFIGQEGIAVGDEIEHTEIVNSPGVNEGLVSRRTMTARELSTDHIGRFVGCNRDGVNYQAKILDLVIYEGGKAPGVSMVLQHPVLPSQDAWQQRTHIPFETQIELIELVSF